MKLVDLVRLPACDSDKCHYSMVLEWEAFMGTVLDSVHDSSKEGA